MLLRPRSLHRELVDEAQRQGVSLNQYINVALARSVGRSVASGAVTEEPGWPGLKAAARQVLLAAGLAEEASESLGQMVIHEEHAAYSAASTEGSVEQPGHSSEGETGEQ